MGLTGRQREEFSQALQRAMPDPGNLAIAIEAEFDLPYNEVTQGADVYSQACFNLVGWASAHGKLTELAGMVAIRVPGNPEVQDFLNQHWLTLLKLETQTLPDSLLDSLSRHLQCMNDFVAVAECCYCTWPSIETHRPLVLQALKNAECCHTAKWLIVLSLWLKKMPHQSDGSPYILSFVQRLQDCMDIDAQLREALAGWLTQAVTQGITAFPATQTLNSEQKERLQQIQGYCVIDIDILETQANFIYRCQLHIQVGANNEFGENQALPIANKPADDLPPLPNESPALTSEEAICRCPKFLPVRQQMGFWLTQVQQRLADKCADLKLRYGLAARPEHDLLVEFCLPWEHLVESVDAWEFVVEVRRRLQQINLGRKYRVVVRSRDRIQDRYGEINQLNKIWNNNQELLQGGVITPEDWTSLTPILANLEPLRLADDAQLAAEFENYVGIGVSGPLCCVEQNDCREKLLNGALEAGVPVVVWSRDPEIEHLETQLREDLLAIDCFHDFNILMERTVDKRALASPQQPLGYHLAVWCDEPRRIEALNELSSKARLG
jgi:hypothetical protein